MKSKGAYRYTKRLHGRGAKKDIPMLNHIVSFMYNPEAKCQDHLLTIPAQALETLHIMPLRFVVPISWL